ncbi:M23 family metallopeptidase [Amycolatopsis sp. NBC_00345]|uniref:M23 family metallopeptidase n=1 Tax=Amycolatopsis sp. NBC_00345 TaxID=2975955 RepID=UPI002E2604C1
MTKLRSWGTTTTAAAVLTLTAGVLLAGPAAAESAPSPTVPSPATAFPAMAFPFALGQQVYSAGIHSDDGSDGVKNAIDFSPADRTVRAPLAGTVHLQHCSGGDWVTIDHAGGWRTGYYHMEAIQVTDGEQVEAGAPLGSTGNALPCGGSSTGAHVHFTLWTLPAAPATAAAPGDREAAPGDREAAPRDREANDREAAIGDWDNVSYARLTSTVAAAYGQPVDGKEIGGWQFTAGAEQYDGTATHLADRQLVQLPGRFRDTP